MRRLWFLLIPATVFGGQTRYARLGEFEGTVEVQLAAAEPWAAAVRNLPLPESAWVRTGPGAKLEIEFDDGAAFRLGPDSLAEISDLTRLSTGQRVTLLSLDHGIAYFTGQPEGTDALSLAVPGAQVTLRRGARIRLEAAGQWSQAAVIEGGVRFSAPAAEFDLGEGQTARVEPAHTARFFLYREVTAHDPDRWNEQRDRLQASPVSGRHVPAAFGAADLDQGGEWVETEEFGAVWRPKVAEGWVPYRDGRWQWYDALGYTWISGDAWGWLPYHYGRWTRKEALGWVWVPARSAVFKPGDVYWLRGAKIAGWGPLAPGEDWSPAAAPQQFLNANTIWATFQQDAKVIDPAGFTPRPKDPLGAAAFTLALPSPALPAARLDAPRPPLRVGSTRVVPVLAGVTFRDGEPESTAPVIVSTENPPGPPSAQPVAVVTNPGAAEAPVVVVQNPAPEPLSPQEVIYAVPVYTGIIVVNPPENEDHRRRRIPPPTQTPPQPKPNPQPQSDPKPAPGPVAPRLEPAREQHNRAAAPPTSPPAQPAPRSEPARQQPDRPVPAKEGDNQPDGQRPRRGQ